MKHFFESYSDCRKSTGNKLGYWYAKGCVLVLLLYFMNNGCVLECRDTPMSQGGREGGRGCIEQKLYVHMYIK